MTITTTQFKAWLKNPSAVRVVLVEVDVKLAAGGSIVTRYLSNRGYVTSPTDTPANTVYKPVLNGGVKFSQAISLDGNATLSFGDLELSNLTGELDTWIDDYWVNRSIRIYIGDQSWPRADFQLIFAGVVMNVDSKKRDTFNIQLSDVLQRLNFTVTESKLGGTTTNADQTIPLCFGECHNVEPLLVDPALHEYQVHGAGDIERIIEVRDNGVPVAFTPFLATGKFRLVNHPVGQITASVQGDKSAGVYSNNIAEIFKRLVKNFGSATNRLTDADLDLASLSAFTSAHTQPVGVYIKDRENLLDICNQLARSVGARVVASPTGLVSLVQISLPQSSSGTSVTSANMVDRSLEISGLPKVVASLKLGYAKNWTVQENLATGILEEHRKLFAQEWLTVTRTDSTTASNYNLFVDPDMDESFLLVGADASDEALRRLNIFNVQRKMFRFKGYAELLTEELGDPITLTHSRFGLSSGVTGQILAITKDWITQRVDLEVLV
jgi:hypothetical protein